MYKRRVGTAGISGQLYEIDLLMLVLLDGVTRWENQQVDQFYLATNMLEAGDFDDVVFKYTYNENGSTKSNIIFLQAKHKEAEKEESKSKAKEKNITMDTLLSQKFGGDFNLRKYLSSYRKVKQQLGLKKDHPIFHDGSVSCEFLIFTTALLSSHINRNRIDKVCLEEKKAEPGSVFEEISLKYYKFNPNKRVMDALKNSLDFEILVNALAESVSSGTLDGNKYIFQDYEICIAERVLEEIGQGEGKLREDFLEGEQDEELSSAFIEEIKKKKEEFANKSLDELKEELKMIKVQLPKNFGNNDDENNFRLPLPCKSFSDEEIEEFLNVFKLCVGQPKETELAERIKRKMESIYKIDANDTDAVFSDVQYKVRKWWREGNEYVRETNRFFQDSARVSMNFDLKEPVPLFTGRDEELEHLHELLHRNQGNDKLSVISQTICVSGLGGIGKSELARKYAHDRGDNYDGNVIWINAENEMTLDDSFRRLAMKRLRIPTQDDNGKEKDIQSIVEQVYNFISKKKSLFIFDNAENNVYLNTFLPLRSLKLKSKKPYILITSRNREWDKELEVMDLNELKLPEAIEFVKKGLYIKDESQDQIIIALVEKLQCFPLAIEQAISYIYDEGVTGSFNIDDYLGEYEEKTKELLDSQVFKGIVNDYSKTTFTTWKITIDKIARNEENGSFALKILNIVAYLAPQNINRGMFLRMAGGDEKLVKSAVRLLVKYSMMKGEARQSVLSVHRLVQDVTRLELEGKGIKKQIIKMTFHLLRDTFHQGEEMSDGYLRRRQLLPHLEVLLSHLDNWLRISPGDRQQIEEEYLEDLLTLMSVGHSNVGNPKRQKELLERVLELQEKRYGSDDLKIGKTLMNLGVTYWSLGNPSKQKEVLERAKPILLNHLGQESIDAARIYQYLGIACGDSGDPRTKIGFLEKALSILEMHYATEDLEIASALRHLSNAYGDLGDNERKKQLLERVLEIQKRHYGDTHFEVGRTMRNLGIAYGDLGHPDVKKDYLETALSILEENFGAGNFEVGRTLRNLGNAYGDLGNPERKKDLLERALPIIEEHFGAQNFEVGKLLRNLGNAYGDIGNHQRKRDLLERALDILEKHFGSQHFEVAKALRNLGNAYGKLGQHEKRKEYLERALPILKNHFGTDHPEVTKTMENLRKASKKLTKLNKGVL